MPSGYYVSYGGAFENLVAAKKRLSIAVPLSLLLIFLLLYFAFHCLTFHNDWLKVLKRTNKD